MYLFIIFAALIFQGFGYRAHHHRSGHRSHHHVKDQPTSIINGDLADILDYPYYVSLRTSNGAHGFCGGAIIKPDVILTAAHCMIIDNITVYPGLTTTDDVATATGYKAIKKAIHPFYAEWLGPYFGSFHDLALLKLEKDITLGTKAQIIEIGTDEPEEGDKVQVVGFGKDKCDLFHPDYDLCINQGSKHLRAAILTVNDIGFGQIETSGINQHVCQGDSGGPMVYDDKVIGVASIADLNCTLFNVYTRLSTFTNKKWLEKQLKLF